MCDKYKVPLSQLQWWAVLWVIMIFVSMFALRETMDNCEKYIPLWKTHNITECAGDEYILLSRAFTTIGWARGFAIGYAWLSIGIILWSPYDRARPGTHVLVKIPLCVALAIFSSAFDVSMFEDNSHGILIAIGSLLGMVFTFPGIRGDCNMCYRTGIRMPMTDWCPCTISTRTVWWILWCIMMVSFTTFGTFVFVSCEPGESNRGYFDGQCPALRSNLYWAEYIYFWTMYLLVGFVICIEETVPCEPRTKRIDFVSKKDDGANNAENPQDKEYRRNYF